MYSKVSKKNIKKWCTALRSGKYKQGTGSLQTHKGFCCLGVACDVFIPKKNQNLDGRSFLEGHMPDMQPNAPIWLQTVNTNFHAQMEISLAYSNDNIGIFRRRYPELGGLNFNEIADLLEAVYIHEVLSE